MLTSCKDELPNPYKNCIREMLSTLICSDNDVKRLNTELRNIQKEYKEEMEKFDINNIKKKPIVCEGVDEITDFAKEIAHLDETKEHYRKRIEDIRKNRDNIITYARQCMQAYNEEKCKFKAFHENTVDYLKRTATLSEDAAVIANCEKDICEMHKLFVKEVTSLKRCESELLPFFKLLKESDPNAYCECCCLKDYDWLPTGKNMEAVDKMADDIKEQMGQTLTRAFAQLHVHQPQDPKSFIAAYLMNLERNEELMKEKLNMFQN